jgi:hypothetical protein
LLDHGDLNFVILYDYTLYVYVLFFQSGKETQATHNIFEIFKKTKVEDLKEIKIIPIIKLELLSVCKIIDERKVPNVRFSKYREK